MLVRASTSALICIAELSAPVIEEAPLEPALPPPTPRR